jgi:hypothetical protein
MIAVTVVRDAAAFLAGAAQVGLCTLKSAPSFDPS